MTAATAKREGRWLAEKLAAATPHHRAAVLRVTHPQVRTVAAKLLERAR